MAYKALGQFQKVNVLLLSWKDVDDETERDEFRSQLHSLAEELKSYRFAVEEYEIESDMSYRKLSRRFEEFLAHDQEGGLLIVYYGGHGINNRDSHCIWLRDNPEDTEEAANPRVNWSNLQGLFHDGCRSHVLFLLDCCYAGSSAKITNSTSTVEVIAAAGFEQVAPLRGPDSFTTFLIKVLKEVRSEETSIVASVLSRYVGALMNSTDADKAERVTPRHFPLHDGKGYIELRPLSQQSGSPVLTSIGLNDKHSGFSPAPYFWNAGRDALNTVQDTSPHTSRDTPKWNDALMDDHQSGGAQPSRTAIMAEFDAPPTPLPYPDVPPTPRPQPLAPRPDPPPTPRRRTSSMIRNRRQASPERPSSQEARRQILASARTPTNPGDDPRIPVASRRQATFDQPKLFSTYSGITYQPLESRQIRVLNLKSSAVSPKDGIVVSVEVVSLPESPGIVDPNYKALSWYCSEEAQWNAHALVLPAGHPVAMPTELFFALLDIRHPIEEVSVWVYQMCIDRHNQVEKEEQTSLVPDIFRTASEVIIWPGQGNELSDMALEFVPQVIDLRNIDDLVVGSRSSVPTPISNTTMRFGTPPQWPLGQRPDNSFLQEAAGGWRQDLTLPPRTPIKSNNKLLDSEVPEKWKSLVEFMARPYFTRRWAFLEVALARSARIYCGSSTVSWPDFCDAVTLLGSRFEEVKLLLERAEMMVGSLGNHSGQLADLRALAAYSFVEASRDLFPRQSDGSIIGLCSLEKTISALPALRSWHPNAVIYALLPLASDADKWDDTASLTPFQAYQHLVHHCARISGSLDIICRPWAPSQRALNRHLNLKSTALGIASWISQVSESQNEGRIPSWVCQIDKHPFGNSDREVPGRRNGEIFVGSAEKPIYNASKSSRANPLFGQHLLGLKSSHYGGTSLPYDGTMTTAGFEVAPISKLYPRAADGLILADWIRAFGFRAGQSTVPDHLWRTLVADRGPGGTPAPAWYHRACHYWLEIASGKAEDDEDINDISYQTLKEAKHSSMVVQYLVRARSVIWNRLLFTLEGWDGRLLYGLAPKETVDGDVVCILYGCSVPVVMRRGKGGQWGLVGECFVYGIMDGEAVDAIIGQKRGKVKEFLIGYLEPGPRV